MYMLKNAFGIFWRSWGSGEAGLSGNQPPILRKSVTDFEEIHHRFRGNPSPILRKCVTDFGEKHVPFLGKTGSVLGTNKFGLGKNWFGLGAIGSVFGLAWDKAQVSLL